MRHDWQAGRDAVARRSREGARLSDVREARQPGIERRHLEGEGRAPELDRRDGSGRQLRSQDRRSKRRCRTRAKSSARCSATTRRRRPCRAKSFRRASSTTTKRSISTRDRRVDHPGGPRSDEPRDEIQRLSIVAFKAIDCAGMARVDFLLEPGQDLPQRGEHDPRVHHHQHVLETLGRVRRRLPGAARSAGRAGARTARREAAAPHQRDMTARCGGAPLLARVGVRSAPPRDGASRLRVRSAASMVSPAPTISSSKRDSIRSDAELRRACGPAPPEACEVLDRHRALVADPSRSRKPRRWTTSSRPPSIARSPAPKRGRTARPTMPRRGSTRAAPTRRACSGACCARKSSPPRATARASSWRSSARSSSIPRSRTRTSASACTSYYADVAPAAAKFLRFLLLLPGGDRKEGLEQMLRARKPRPAAAGRSGLPAPRHLSLVRAADAPRAAAAAVAARALPRATRSSSRRSPRSRTSISTTSPPAWRPGSRCWPRRGNSASNAPVLSEVQARLGIAKQLEALQQTDDAIEHAAEP